MLWLKILTVDDDIGFIPLDQISYFEFGEKILDDYHTQQKFIRIFIKDLAFESIEAKNVVVVSGDKVLTAINDHLF